MQLLTRVTLQELSAQLGSLFFFQQSQKKLQLFWPQLRDTDFWKCPARQQTKKGGSSPVSHLVVLLNKSSCGELGSADTCQSWANVSAQKAGGYDFSCIKRERSVLQAFPFKGCTSISKYLYFKSQRSGLLWLLMKNVQETSINLHKPRIYLMLYWNVDLMQRRMKSRRRHTNLGAGARRCGLLTCDVTYGCLAMFPLRLDMFGREQMTLRNQTKDK